MNLQRKGDTVDLLMLINLILPFIYLGAFESLNESITILLISFRYVGVKKKALITPAGAVVLISFVSTLESIFAFFSLCWQSML